jgi:hypothetical protein
MPVYRYAGGIIVSSVLFSLLFKWQPWGVRLQLPLFLLGAPLVGYGVDSIKISRGSILIGVMFLGIFSLPYLTLNSTRPLVPIFRKNSPLRTNKIRGFFSDRPDLYQEYAELIAPFYKEQSILRTERERLYFAGNQSIYQNYQDLMDSVNDLGTDRIGLLLGSNDWEYPIWVMADRHASPGLPVIIHIDVSGPSQDLFRSEPNLPKYVISTKMLDGGMINGEKYVAVIQTSSISLLEK